MPYCEEVARRGVGRAETEVKVTLLPWCGSVRSTQVGDLLWPALLREVVCILGGTPRACVLSNRGTGTGSNRNFYTRSGISKPLESRNRTEAIESSLFSEADRIEATNRSIDEALPGRRTTGAAGTTDAEQQRHWSSGKAAACKCTIGGAPRNATTASAS